MNGTSLRGSVGLALLVATGAFASFTGCNGGGISQPTGLGANGTGPGSTTTSTTPPIGSDGGAPTCIEPSCQQVALATSTNAIRLTHVQWENTTKDLLKLPVASGLSASFPADPLPPKDEFGIDYSQLIVSNALWQEYQSAAEALATLVTTNPAQLALILPAGVASDPGADPDARVKAFLNDFLPRAFRRAPTDPIIADPNTGAVAALLAFGDTTESADISLNPTDDPFLTRMRWILTQVLQSPYFLYRVEAGSGAPDADGRVRLMPYETAEKLAYALWGTMPDDNLRALAANGQLVNNTDIAAQATIMLQDPRANAMIATFHDLLFNVTSFQSIVKQPALFPQWYPNFGADVTEDTRLAVQDLVINGNGGVKELYTSNDLWVTPALAAVYDIDPSSLTGTPNADGFYQTTLPSNRIGILAHAGWLAWWSHTVDPASILRGVWVARHLLCIPLGSPPAGAESTPISTDPAKTNRQRVTDITANGPCPACHTAIINPMGFSFEEFDAVGHFRTTENGYPVGNAPGNGPFPIDSSGTTQLLGSFNGEVAMVNDAVSKPDAHACYAAHWNAYLNGTPVVSNRPAWLSPIAAHSMAGASTRDIIVDLVQTDAFLTVSSPAATSGPHPAPSRAFPNLHSSYPR